MLDIVSIQLKETELPLYQSLAEAIERQLRERDVLSGERLPSVRTLAKQLGVNPSTVVAAYHLLEKKGVAYTKLGSGTYLLPPTVPPPQDDLEGLFGDYAELNSGRLSFSEGMIDLAGNAPAADVFPVAEFKKAINTVLDTDGGYAFSYQESEGYYPLREILASFSGAQYGIRCCPQEILVTAGAQQALDLLCKAMLHPGDTVFAEMPSYIGMRSVFALHDAKLFGVPMEPDGLSLDILAYYAQKYRPRLLYTMPVYQTPTGVSMSAEKRRHLLKLAAQYDFYIIEDDLFSDINLKGERLYPLKSEDADGRVVYVKSFSKLLMPGIRTGYVIAPQNLLERLSAVKYATDISGSGLIQRALTAYFQKGCWSENIVQISHAYQERAQAALANVSEWKRFGVRIGEVRGGFGLWLTLPEGIADREIYYRCKAQKVLIAPGSLFYITPMAGFERHLRISFASSREVEKGLRVVGECIRSVVNKHADHTIFI
ncbi:PLP-dependent aminotransferase family protein [Ethanoligenens sp.]|uniref:MocR-like pyridoxine biosynthesis transcription factor PdxR n=1 Tax=Ethanoligenens sp. TaxID=2099655 RepID=UPI0039E7DA39